MELESEIEELRCGRAFALAARAGAEVREALLGKTPRYAPDRSFDTLHVRLDLSLDFVKRSAWGTCKTAILPFSALRSLEFDAVELKVSQVRVDGRRARFSAAGGKLRIRPARALKPGRRAEVTVSYRTDRPKAGLHFVFPRDGGSAQAWSQSQPEDARHWYPCHDNPQQKCTSETRITVPAGFRVVSNGRLLEHSRSKGRETWHWRMERAHAIYLISIAAGKFSEIMRRWGKVPVAFYCEKGREEDAKRGFAKTVKAMEFFSRETGVPYPYEKYAQVAVAEYPGGMEHTTCTTQTDACLIDQRAALDFDLDLLVAHELAHQWFGDLVTCRDWSHAWLNEGFATYFEILFQGHDKGRDALDHELCANAKAYFEEDASRYRRPIVCPIFRNPWTLFDRHTYLKGGWVVHMLRQELGEKDFRRSIKLYLESHRDASVETSDLVAAIARATGRNLKPFFDQWVFRAGYPVLRARYRWNAKRRGAELWVGQAQEIGEAAPAFSLSLPVRFIGKGWSRDVVAKLEEKERRFFWPLPAPPLDVELDSQLTLLMKLSLSKPHAMWLRQLRHAQRAHARAAAAQAVAAWPGAESVAALEGAIRSEPFWGAAAEMAGALAGLRCQAAFKALTRLLKHPQPKLRRTVVEALAGFNRPEAAQALERLARADKSLFVQAEALRGLGALAPRKALALIRSALASRSYRDVLGASGVAALAAAHQPKNVGLLLRLSRPPHEFLRRQQALKALQRYATVSERCLDGLCEAAGDGDERVVVAAVAALGQLAHERALPTLEKARSHPNTRVRVIAEEAIARLRGGFALKSPR